MRKLKISRIIILILVPILIVSGGVCVAYMLFTQKESVIEEKSLLRFRFIFYGKWLDDL